ncbi:hypothetical protein LTR17_022529 [Elasticomyces elasticus]|nr:hypothetical protein LTR17_022529 [Elasticomyces elasticus]
MSTLDKRGNGALQANPFTVNGASADIHITTHGSDWYWAAHTKPRQQRIFHYITASIMLVASVAYFSMGSNLGWTPIGGNPQRSNPVVRGMYREIFYVRYIDWPTILYVILIDEVMIITGLVGALVYSNYKWAYFVFGCMALFYIVYVLAWEARKHANAMGKDVGKAFLICGSLTTFLWMLYPIAWGLCEGGNVVSPDSEAVFYGILDLLAKPVFGALLIWGHKGIDPARLGLHIHDYDEKDQAIHGNGHNDVANGEHTNGTNGAPATTV